MTRGEGGGVPAVSAAKALAHVESLQQEFPTLSRRHISRLAGIGEGTLSVIQRSQRVSIEIEGMILAVEPRHVLLSPPATAPVKPVVEHIEGLIRQTGCTPRAIGEVSGLTTSGVHYILSPTRKTVRWETAQAILSITPDQVRGRVNWERAEPSINRLRALQALGHGIHNLGRRRGFTAVVVISKGPDDRIERSLAAVIAEVYEELRDQPGTDLRAARAAHRAGYKTPDWYDDEMRPISKEDRRHQEKQAKARDSLRAIGLSIEGRSSSQIMELTGISERIIASARKSSGLTMEQGYIELRAKETRPGALAAARAAVARIDYWTTVDSADEPELDYVALLDSLGEPEGYAKAVA